MRRAAGLLIPPLILLALAMPVRANALPADSGITVDGRATGPEGRGIAGARVELRPILSSYEEGVREAKGSGEPPPEVTAVSREDGRFSLAAPRAGMWVVTVRAAGFVPVRTQILPLLEPAALPDTALRREAGPVTPVAGERVREITVREANGAPPPGVVARDSRSGLVLGWIPPGQSGGTVSAGSGAQVLLETADGRRLALPSAAESLHATLPPPALRAGRILGDLQPAGRQPIAGAWVWPVGDPGRAVRSDARGAYRLEGSALPEGVSGAAAGFLTAVMPAPRGPQGELRALVLTPAGSVAGMVVDAEGRPLESARVQAVPLNPYDEAPAPQAWTAAGGSFHLTGLKTRTGYRIDVRRAGFAPRSVGLGTLTAAVSGLRVVLQRGAAAFGDLVEADGRPVERAEVELVRTLADSAGTSLGRTVAGAGGHFFLRDLSSGPGELLVRRPGRALFLLPGLEIPDAEAADLGRIVLPGGETLTGRAVDPQGSPLAGVEVWMNPGDPTAPDTWGAQPFTRTGADGRFTVTDLAPQAAIVLSLCHEGSLPEELVLGSVPAETVTVTLRPAGVLSGTVEGPDGAPVPGALVYTRRAGGRPEEIRQACATADQEVTTDGEGRFALPPLEPGWYTVFAQGKGFRRGHIDRLEVRAGPGSPLRFALERGAALAGRVSDPAGEPVFRAAVSIVRNGYGVQATTDTDGRYRLEGLDTGSVAVTAWATEQGYAETKQSTEIVPGENGLDITLAAAPPRPAQHAVHGRVVGPRGEAVPGAIVSGLGAGAVSAVDGSFQLSLPEGKTTLWARSADYPFGGRTIVEVGAAGVLRGVQIRLLPRVELSGRLTGLAADETAWAWVMATSSDQYSSIRGRVSADGSYLVAPLTAGDWRLVAGTGGRLTTPRSLHIGPEEAAVAADLDFPPVSSVSGRVAEAAGEPVPQAEVLFSGMESSVTATTRADGSFEARLADGEYSVRARRRGSEAEGPGVPLVVAGAAAGLEIRLSPEIELHGRIRGLAPGQIPSIQIADPISRAGTVDTGGAFHLSDLRPGTWTLRVKLDAEGDNLPRLLTANVTVREGDTDVEMDLTFPPENP